MAKIICKNCGNDIWDIREWESRAYCTNCNEPRLYIARNRKSGLTKSQKVRISAAKDYFLTRAGGEKLHRFEVIEEDWAVYVVVETTESALTMRGGMFQVGRRGKVECLNVYDLTDDKDGTARHYERMIKCH